MNIVIKNGKIIDPFNNRERVASILIEDGKIAAIGQDADLHISKNDNLKVVDASGKWVVPAFIDLHCHIREPGFAYKETMHKTLMAAAAGGYSTICIMPNLEPAVDQRPTVEHIHEKAKKLSLVDLFIIGAITEGRKGKALAKIGALYNAGVVGLSDDGSTVMNSKLMMMGMYYAKTFGLTIISHCEDMNLAEGGSVNLGKVSTEMGLTGIPNASEDIIIARDIQLAELTGISLHIAHLSTRFGVELIRLAKKRGLSVTAEVTPHHFTLTEDEVREFNVNAKMNPPLRTQKDVDAILEGLADGTIDAIATDHAPHAVQEKEREFDLAPFGIIGLETAFPLGLRLVKNDVISEMELIKKLTSGPASILPVGRCGLTIGADANITVLDPDLEWCFDRDSMAGKAINSPFLNNQLKGRVLLTLNKGNIIWELSNE